MFTKTQSATLLGLEPIRVEVEVNGGRGVPGLVIVGLPSQAVNEAKERVTTSIQNLGIRIKSLKTIINLAPADVRKDTAHLELAMAVGLLQLYKVIPPVNDRQLFLGELSLSGRLKPIRGTLPLVLAAQKLGHTEIYLPTANLSEVPPGTNCQVFGLESLQTFWNHARGHSLLTPYQAKPTVTPTPNQLLNPFSEIRGQHLAKQALVAAAAGGHHLLMVGPPGTGKTALAESFLQLLPSLSEVQALQINSLYSVAGLVRTVPSRPPFRSLSAGCTVHHLIGGGSSLKLGEVTLAHQGVLFLDEIPEFKKPVLEALRGPLESGRVLVSSRWGTQIVPARFILLATSNPCSCGYLGSHQKVCRCSLYQQDQYSRRLSGPIRDRIEIQVPVSDLDYTHWALPETQLDCHFTKIPLAREQQEKRYATISPNCLNGQVPTNIFKNLSKLSTTAEKLLLKAAIKFQLSGRGYMKTWRVAQTLADLEASSKISEKHIAQALQFRTDTKVFN